MFETARINPPSNKVEVIGSIKYESDNGYGYIFVDGYYEDGEYSGKLDLSDFDDLTVTEHKDITDNIHEMVADNIDNLFTW